ncbi:MAG: class I SAM-dependent DNA methyltransferase [Candidatus Sumerlaeia bacterium]|nr:class I SAM-dependent DNA methyltransferase [Candidatus Sumerlaeia bacterium]
MITGQLKSKIDKLWEEFWTGGITNPLTVIEQISYLMFLRLLDIRESRNETMLQRLKERGGTTNAKLLFRLEQQHLRWSVFKEMGGDQMLELMQRNAGAKGGLGDMGIFEHMRKVCDDTNFGRFFRDAQLMIQKPSLLVNAVNMVSELPLTSGDTKGDLYEYLLSKLTTAGVNGQFRTPRHIIDMMVALVEPKVGERIADPACGTAGFLVRSMEYILRTNTSKEGEIVAEDGSVLYTGDLLSEMQRFVLQTDTFEGFDFDATMLRLSAMNLLLHGVEQPRIRYQDTLGNSFPERYPDQAQEYYDVILANPPFKGSLDTNDVMGTLKQKVKTTKTELLFLVLILQMLQQGGRCAVVVPNGVQFGSSGAHVDVRKLLVEENQLEAVIGLPSGVFKPYAGVSTAVLVFTKGGKTEDVFFYDVAGDGFSLDDKRQPDDANNDLPDVLAKWAEWKRGKGKKKFTDRKAKAFSVSREEIKEQKYDLSVSRYKEHVHEEQSYEKPQDIIKKLRELEEQISADLNALEGMLKG